MMRHRISETIKNIMIVLLLGGIVLLTVMALPLHIRDGRVLSSLSATFGGAVDWGISGSEDVQDAAQPYAISIKGAAGRQSFRYSFSELDVAYDEIGGLLGEALNTAGSFTEITSAEYLAALSENSVLFAYHAQLPANVLALWLDAAMPENAPYASMYLLHKDETGVRLYLSGDKQFFCETRLKPEALQTVLNAVEPDGTIFSFESGAFTRLDDLTLFKNGHTPSVRAASAYNPCDEKYLTALATTLGFNPYGDSRYTDYTGTTWFTETNRSLTASAGGEIAIVNNNQTDTWLQAPGDTASVLIETARAILDDVWRKSMGDARLYLTEFSQNELETVCTFEYVLDGLVVSGEEPAATVVFSGRSVTRLSARVRQYTLMNEMVSPMPIQQAAAIAAEGQLLQLVYADTGTGVLTVGWKA